MTNPLTHFESPIGTLYIETNDTALTKISFTQPLPYRPIPNKNKIIQQVVKELCGYFENPNFKFSVPIQLNSTPFQQKVWQALQEIPSGETRTYGELAKLLNTSARAIGNACRANPIPIIIPCHRVVSKTGLGGYSGKTVGDLLYKKCYLLALEKKD